MGGLGDLGISEIRANANKSKEVIKQQSTTTTTTNTTENTNTNSTTTKEKPKSRNTGGGRFVSYRYPNKMLTGSTDYLKIKVVEYLSLIHISEPTRPY